MWFPGEPGAADSVKDIRSGDQVPAQAATWLPPQDDAAPRVLSADDAAAGGPAPDGTGPGTHDGAR